MKRAAWVLSLTLVAGCGGRVSNEVSPDASAVDAVVFVDTRPPQIDSFRPLPDGDLWSCAEPISGFACEPAASRPGKTVCSDEMIEEFLNCFGSDGDPARCNAARMMYRQCNTCLLEDWLKVNAGGTSASPDVAACIKSIDPSGTCSAVVNCAIDCEDLVCGECNDTPGSGLGGSLSSSERMECARDVRYAGSTTKLKGACYDLAYKDYDECSSDPRFTHCFIRTVEDLRYFYRGACRDGGNWSGVTVDKPTIDAGTDG